MYEITKITKAQVSDTYKTAKIYFTTSTAMDTIRTAHYYYHYYFNFNFCTLSSIDAEG